MGNDDSQTIAQIALTFNSEWVSKSDSSASCVSHINIYILCTRLAFKIGTGSNEKVQITPKKSTFDRRENLPMEPGGTTIWTILVSCFIDN